MENMDRMCKYCSLPEDKQDSPGLVCMTCVRFVHISCLRRPGTPGDFTCDVFFDFTCEHCSDDKTEKFVRNRFPWVNVILLTLHHLNYQSYGISNNGFFHYKTHICYFIDRHWSLLLGTHTKQKKNWVGTIAGALSVYNNLFFRSGSTILGETGWWKLLHNFSPAVAAHILQEMSRDKLKGRSRNSMGVDRALFTAKVASIGYKDLVNEEPEGPLQPPKLEPGAKRRRLDTAQDHPDPRLESVEDNPLDGPLPPAAHEPSSEEALFRGFDFHSNSYLPPSDSSSIHSFQQTALYEDSDTRSVSPYPALLPFDEDPKPFKPLPETKKKQTQEEKQILKRDNLFSSEPNSIDLPWIEELPEPKKGLVEMTQYEEVQLLKQVEGLIPKVRDPNGRASLYQLKAKLALRRLKRHKHLPLFDLDKALKVSLGQGPDAARAEASAERVLDRFQRSYLLDNLSGTIALWSGGTVLPSRGAAKPFRSPYSGAALKPYVRRDAQTQPLWLRLTDELLTKANRHVAGYSPPPRASLDFSYVRPQHLAAVNSLAAQFFWPGIDLSESLEYPEFSCVVSYRQLVVGFAFLVPDAGAHEAYISFVLTRPEWRNAGIGSFMLYHLLQTCSGKDVTLHVSPTNPAIFLYQKFGFKVEELIQDFYEKYYDIDYKGCRHALFLRLVR